MPLRPASAPCRRHSESETMARAANQLMSESYKFPSVKRAVVAKQVHSSDKEDNARPQSVQEEARELRQLTLPSHHSGDALLVIVINGGVYKHSSSAELNVKEQMPHIPVDTRPARLTLRQLAREKKRQVRACYPRTRAWTAHRHINCRSNRCACRGSATPPSPKTALHSTCLRCQLWRPRCCRSTSSSVHRRLRRPSS